MGSRLRWAAVSLARVSARGSQSGRGMKAACSLATCMTDHAFRTARGSRAPRRVAVFGRTRLNPLRAHTVLSKGAVRKKRTHPMHDTITDGGTPAAIGQTGDRVRAHTDPALNAAIDQEIADHIRLYANADKELIGRRLEQLDREWDMERTLETNAATVSLVGLISSVLVSRKWLALPLVVASFLLQHAVQGWCPPVPVFRRFGVRTRQEIERERHALRLLRGDFDGSSPGQNADVARIVEAMKV